jgi:hypothetical protein
MKKMSPGLSLLLATSAMFQAQNPELADWMNSPEEEKRLQDEFEKFIDKKEENEPQKDESKD